MIKDMEKKKKLTASEKNELKAKLKKSCLTVLHVVSYILSAIAIILIAIGCSQSGNKKANAQSVVTTPIITQPFNANLVDFKADDYYKSLPSDYVVSVSLPSYEDITTYLPSYSLFNYYFESLIGGDTWNYYEAQAITLDNSIVVDDYTYNYIGVYITDDYILFSLFSDFNPDNSLDILGVSANNVVLPSFSDYEQIKSQNISFHLNANIYSFDDHGDIITGSYPRFVNRFYWWFLSTDTYRHTIKLDSYNLLNAVAYLGLETLQNNAIVHSSDPLSSVDMLVGNIYYNGLSFTRVVYNFSPIYKGANSELRILTGGSFVKDHVENAQIFALCNDTAYQNYYYLDSVYLRGNNNDLKIFEAFKHIHDSEGSTIFDDFFSVHDIYVSFYNNVVNKTNTWILQIDSVNLYFLGFLPNFKSNDYLMKYAPTTIVGVFSGYILPPINIEGGESTTDMFSQVFEWITFIFYGLSAILTFQILPSISLGLLLLIPFLFTIILFIVKLFKR